MTARAPRIGVVGVVRRRQGLGEHIARWLVAAGAEVPAFIGSRQETLDEGRTVLAGHGIQAAGYPSLASLLDDHPLDGLVIAAPPATHDGYLTEACAAGLPVLCEKPFVWGTEDDAVRTAHHVSTFAAAGLPLWECVQWPLTLPAYRQLHPTVRDAPVRHVEMWLSPTSGGAGMIADSMSHPLSLVQALMAPSGPIEGLCFSTVAQDAGRLEALFRVSTVEGGSVVRVRLARKREQPRPAGYALNGVSAERRVRMEDYALSFEHDGRTVPVPDPLAGLVAGFVAAVRGEAAGPEFARGESITWRMQALMDVVDGFARSG